MRHLCSILTICIGAVLLGGCGPAASPTPHLAIPRQSTAPITDSRRSLIIYPPGFAAAAQAFSYLHRQFGGVEAILVPLAEIRQAPPPGPEMRRIPFAGWDTARPVKTTIKGYDSHLARQIIAYLRNLPTKDNILAVVLLGDGALIPPSYYFHVPYLSKMAIGDKPYNEWIASDLLYASPDLDLELEWAVGRISVDTPEQALRVAEKYYKWNLTNLHRQPDPFVFFSGNIRDDLVYSGELLYQLFEGEKIVGSGARHYFQSDNRFTIDHLEDSFRNDPATIHYVFTHGSGDGFTIDGEYLRAHQIAAMPYKLGLPLVISPSCIDGGFDFDLAAPPSSRDSYSIGEAVLRSDGAGIGYLGSSRVSLGQFFHAMEDGLVDDRSIYYRYMPGLLNDFMRSWHGGKHRIADAYVDAHNRYRRRFPRFDSQDFATFVELNLLADPVMMLPEPQKTKDALIFDHLVITSPHVVKQRKPFVPPGKPVTFVLNATSRHETATATVVEAKSGKIIHKNQNIDRNTPLVVIPKKQTSYLIRLDFPDRVIDWQFFHSGSLQDFAYPAISPK